MTKPFRKGGDRLDQLDAKLANYTKLYVFASSFGNLAAAFFIDAAQWQAASGGPPLGLSVASIACLSRPWAERAN